LLWSDRREANRRAGAVSMEMLVRLRFELGVPVSQASLFCADLGPGSFTGTRVGVVLAKTLAYVHQVKVSGLPAFDLVSESKVVLLPSKKDEFFVRHPGGSVGRVSLADLDPTLEWVGLGPANQTQTPPDAANFARLVDHLVEHSPESFVPEYLIEPSISVPNRPFPASAI
jgi:tRNA A37 threonylcarbamoyladenosine modification protein TsaB